MESMIRSIVTLEQDQRTDVKEIGFGVLEGVKPKIKIVPRMGYSYTVKKIMRNFGQIFMRENLFSVN
jgi:hypothetical protein